MVINGQIKVKSSPKFEGFDKTGAPVGNEVKSKPTSLCLLRGKQAVFQHPLGSFWGLDEEYELKSVW